MDINPVHDDSHHHHHPHDCCSSSSSSSSNGHHAQPPPPPVILSGEQPDVEKAATEHITLVVNGMTCSGCGTKLERALNSAPGVSGVRINFVMGNAEFDFHSSLAAAAAGPEDVIRTAERATGFRCTRTSAQDQVILDILVTPGTTIATIADLVIPGVVDIVVTDGSRTVRITYDPTVIGARTLLDRLGPLATGLAPPGDDPLLASGKRRMYDQLAKTVAAAVLTIPVAVLAWGGNGELVDKNTSATVSLALATLVQLIAVPDFYKPALSSLVRSGVVEMDMLVVISITAAYVYSVVAFGFRMAPGSKGPLETAELFETSTLLITLVLLGRLVAAYARTRAVAAVSLRSLQASSAVVVESGKDVEVDARLLQYGDEFKVLPHTAVPTDGVVVGGSGGVDESMLTGESVPVFKERDDAIIAGTVNGSGTLVARLVRLPGRNTVTDIAELVEEAAGSKPRIQDVADRVAGWFVPVVASVGVVVFGVWVVVGLKIRNHAAGKAVSDAITYSIAVLAVSCPCALGLAVPMVLVVAGGIAARGGVIIKSAECTERARKVTDVVFDKTGTITEGDLDVIEEEFLVLDHDEARAITAALVAGNKHPVSLAVAKHLTQRVIPDMTLTDAHVIPGAGVEAIFQGETVRAGNPAFTNTTSNPSVTRLQDAGTTLLVVTLASSPIAIFGLRTRLRREAASVIAQLTKRDIAVHLVSGDQTRAVESVAAQVGIRHAASQRTPSQKRDYVASLMSGGRLVMFVGDGTNDAVAVAQADVGVQLGSAASASEVTRGAADVVLLAGLEGVPFLLDVSRASFRRMVFNFVWSAVYNVLAILMAAGAFDVVGVRIEPRYAGLGEIVSVLPVVVAAMTMLTKKIRPPTSTGGSQI